MQNQAKLKSMYKSNSKAKPCLSCTTSQVTLKDKSQNT